LRRHLLFGLEVPTHEVWPPNIRRKFSTINQTSEPMQKAKGIFIFYNIWSEK